MKVMIAVEMENDELQMKTHLVGTDEFDAEVINLHAKVCEHLFCDKLHWDDFVILCAYFDVMRGALKEAMEAMANERRSAFEEPTQH